MAYNTKPIVTDKDGNPIAQYYNPETDSYEPVEGSGGANKVQVTNNDLSLIPILDKLSQLTGTVVDEETRKTNETDRQSKETARLSNENTRESQETDRVNAEGNRVTEEGKRVTAESGRVTAESNRVTKENARSTAETGRVDAENIRKSNEVTRENNETDRIALYNLLLQKLANGEFIGAKGDTGNGLEYQWRGTELGVREKGIGDYIYVDLKGDTGDISNLNSEHIISALGYTPANATKEHSHDNKGVIDKFSEVGGKPYYNGAEIGGTVPNLTLTELTLGDWKITGTPNSLDFEYIGVV